MRKRADAASGRAGSTGGRNSKRSISHSIHVSTHLYRVVHGKAPRGTRTWGFAMGHGSGIVWVSDASFEVAREHALQKAGALGVRTITVLT